MREMKGDEAMILGSGVDIIEIERVAKTFSTRKKKERVFTENEIERIGELNKASLAGCFAAKEACSKALGTGIRGISFTDMEVLKDDLGKPYFNMELLQPHLQRVFGTRKIEVHLSLSHDKERAMAMVLIEEV